MISTPSPCRAPFDARISREKFVHCIESIAHYHERFMITNTIVTRMIDHAHSTLALTHWELRQREIERRSQSMPWQPSISE
jgi:hypothetical protein